MWVILCIAFPFLFTTILGILTEGLYGTSVSSYDYYGVTMLVFSSLYAGTYSANSFLEERIKQPNLRIAYSPISSLFIPILGLLSGLFFPVASLGKTMVSISNFSPVTKVLDTVFVMIYDQNYSQFLPVLLILLLLSLVTMVLIGFLFWNGNTFFDKNYKVL